MKERRDDVGEDQILNEFMTVHQRHCGECVGWPYQKGLGQECSVREV